MSEPTVTLVTSGLAAGGSEIQLTQLALGLRAVGWTVSVVSLQPGDACRRVLVEGGVPVTVVEAGRLASPAALGRLRAAIARTAPDLVHTQAFRANLWGRLAALSLGLPVVASVRATYRYLPRVYFPVERRLAARTTAVITPSRATAEHLVTAVGVPAGRVVTIANGVDTDVFTPSRDGSGVRRGWRLGDGFVVLAPGRLAAQKDHAAVLRAVRRLGARSPELAVVVAGAGPLAGRLRAQARPMAAHVRFTGELDRTAMAAAMAAADAVCLASRYEGCPNVLLEAMAAGRPVVATAVDGVPEIVSEGVEGLLVRPGDEAGLAAALGRLAADAELSDRLGRAGRARAEACHSIAANVVQHCRLYREVLDGEVPSP